MQGAEGVEKCLLDAFFAGEELNVVDQEHIRLRLLLPEACQLIVLNGVDQFVGEFRGGHVSNARGFFMAEDVLTNGMKQMGFSQTHAAVKEERVVGLAGVLS